MYVNEIKKGESLIFNEIPYTYMGVKIVKSIEYYSFDTVHNGQIQKKLLEKDLPRIENRELKTMKKRLILLGLDAGTSTR